MENEGAIEAGEDQTPERKRKRRWLKRLGWLLAIILAPILLGALFLSSPIGKRFVADQIAQVAPASGLRFEVGRIEGDIYGQAVLRDVVLSDPKGEFLVIPEAEIDWNPLAWLWSGLDVRELTARRGRLERLPELLPGDPDAPLLPDFDIRIDKLAIEDFVLAPGVAGDQAHSFNFSSEVDIRSGRALIDADGAFGREDRIALLLDSEPDGDRFDISLDYKAAADGPIAQMAGLGSGYEARVEGEGTWTRWLGHALVTRQPIEGEASRFAAFQITNDAGTYGLLGQVDPDFTPGTILRRASGRALSLALTGTLEDSEFDGQIRAVSSGIDVRGNGNVDLAGNSFSDFDVAAIVRNPSILGDAVELRGARLTGVIDGSFNDLTIQHNLSVSELQAGTTVLQNLAQSSSAIFRDSILSLPLDASVERVVTGNESIDPELVGGTLKGTLTYAGTRLTTDEARLTFPSLDAGLALRGDTASGVYALAGPVNARGLALDGIGTVNANAKLVARFGTQTPWSIRANLAGRLDDVTNASVANVAGERLTFQGAFGMAADQPIVLRDVELDSERLAARFDSRIVGERTSLAGSGRHVDYGPFTVDAELAGDGPRATLILADPYPAAGLADVRLAIAPSDNGFAIDTSGGSLLGPFDGALELVLPANGATQIAIERLQVYRTNVTGDLSLADAGVSGNLALSGGGLDGTVALAPAAGGAQGFDLDLTARQARFGGDTPISLTNADIDASGTFGGGASRILADVRGSGFAYGALSIAEFAANAEVVDGRGDVKASIAGRRSDRFSLKFDGDVTPERIAVLARGEYGGRPITMPRRAVLSAQSDGGWSLAPTQIGFARGYAIVEGELGGGETSLKAQLSQMPLRLADLIGSELGLGGRLSGIVNWNQSGNAAPTASARVRIDDFTRSGLILSSTPMDVLAVADLTGSSLVVGARLREDGNRLGRLDARVTSLSGGSDLARRIMNGRLDASFAYDGAASSLWRLAAIETFDLTGPISVNAKAVGTLNNPRITGNLASDDLRLQSAISGTDIDDVTARGRFAGSTLTLTRFAGTTRGGGKVSGSGTVDLAAMSGSRGPRLDLRAAASNARLLNASGLDATITGPLRIVSDGVGGTIAGRVKIDRASWALGIAAEDMSLPTIATREINRRDTNGATARSAASSWRYLINASAPSRVAVGGLGLDSEWGVDIALRGTVNDPRLGGEARLVRGDYTFAGTRFDMTEGRITFDVNRPIDPRINMLAETDANGTDVTVAITGNAQTPQVTFSSEPALPEEEILAQLLFGGSVTSLSATDALQLGAALASLRGGGGGLDPIGDLRRSIGLDQLRIVSADPAIGRGTGVALGKNIGRRFYVEIVTDGRGYSATSVEYRVTGWLALLGTVSTIGRDSVLAEISRDY
ncbi:translocation/assembly module TamB domain-containing protein [Erythrobacter sp. F6033]|uniref:translocation/assembly module TamB domain-containing protein n=1 Tax=Erythrobacter sp. F6033 TaxID=2926401 RepID=UPI001FF11AA6|nr:translocation/assembly module TamB domain-containing protein [Erythrobacter sp. F6033]MCK0129054.1 translocation/assembly module TamB domain-containing protein [Erythrobacter sp. F6033]